LPTEEVVEAPPSEPTAMGCIKVVVVVAVGPPCSLAVPRACATPSPEPGGCGRAGSGRAPAAAMLRESRLVMASDCYGSESKRESGR
jgi:hypothetical protein